MLNKSLTEKAEIFAKDFFSSDTTGHDWFHTDRVRNQAVAIAEEEGASIEKCEIAALLHDIADAKFHESEKAGKEYLKNWLAHQKMSSEEINDILLIISTVSFKGGNNTSPATLEAEIVHDADRLDAIGAIGIARCFMFAGNKNHDMHRPGRASRENMSIEEYRDDNSSAVDHFYEKLLKLKGLMLTASGKKRAELRHNRLVNFLDDFYSEWEGHS
ncbi:HD domain-containing protein [Alkalicoccus daliensis]|uniref:HD domain-containing protein n=1 Tax=Alkalicoccus daliensis TaxID=745820 RepID=A0A1H0AF39_9BACI|nr:HD domain-containing protein [Alkalicoccus daliensis]SDN32037.1 uncharacterized protein SAMN04488053_101458 [Alkalicoccus daliensis]